MPEHSHGVGGGWAVTRWVVPGCPACENTDEIALENTTDLKALHAWLRQHRPDRPGGTGLSAQAWMDLAELMEGARLQGVEEVERAIREERQSDPSTYNVWSRVWRVVEDVKEKHVRA